MVSGAGGFALGTVIMRAFFKLAVDDLVARAMRAEEQVASFKSSLQRLADKVD